ncbi:zinc transporter ZIP5 [Pelobates cultripes]|uniref:Zinc transporter ZIP5 n=1 Tax=Pelobates cultripes TaxID=61616 RepID=A0AAD1R646_PELCU|nr:zinc transporter ZIP5 [Pelobates cultripes]
MVFYKEWLMLFLGLGTFWCISDCLGKTAALKKLSSNKPQTARQVLVGQTRQHGEDPPSLEDAEKEQGYYLQQLFHLYGENDTLSYRGLTQLLQNLGLGKVQVIEIHHTELGHDHVTHLDILEVQDKKHSHVHSSREHFAPTSGPVTDGRELDKGKIKDGSDIVPLVETGQPVTAKPEPRNVKLQDGIKGAKGENQWPPQYILEHLLQRHHTNYSHQHENCLNVTQLLLNFGLDWVSEITPKHFSLLCPALLYQIDSRVCIQHNDELQTSPVNSQQSLLQVLGWGALAVTVVSAPSLLAIALVPLLKRHVFRYLLRFFVALAVGTLCGDALLHLLPHAQEESQHGGESHSIEPVLKGLTVLGGIYLLFLIENLMGLMNQRRRRRKVINAKRKVPVPVEDCTTVLRDLGHSVDAEFCEVTGAADDLQVRNEFHEEGLRDHESRASVDNHGHSHSAGAGGIAEFVWMVLLGDGIHNFTDGLAIGAAFSSGFSGGLSTSVAVFCHELPHELGDFAVLLQTGVPVKRVLLFSLVSAFLSYLGLLTGVLVSQSSAEVTPWIFAATAGIFLYVALVDMLPQMLNRGTSDLSQGKDIFIHGAGFFLGGVIMLCIALFQEDMGFQNV